MALSVKTGFNNTFSIGNPPTMFESMISKDSKSSSALKIHLKSACIS